MARREFTKAISVEIIHRATKQIGDDPNVKAQFCEECGALSLRFQIDHIDPDGLQIDKSKPLTAAEGKLLCIPCHKEKTKLDVGHIAKAKRREARHLGAVKPKGQIQSAGFQKKAAREPKPKLPPRIFYA